MIFLADFHCSNSHDISNLFLVKLNFSWNSTDESISLLYFFEYFSDMNQARSENICLYLDISHFTAVDFVIFQLMLTQQGWTMSLLSSAHCVIETFNIYIWIFLTPIGLIKHHRTDIFPGDFWAINQISILD